MSVKQDFVVDGIVPVIPTPFTPDEEIDISGLQTLIDFSIAAGVSAVCLPAYASEFYKLCELERLTVVRTAVERAAGELSVIAQVNYISPRQAVATAQEAQQAGASAINAAVPRLFPVSQRDLFRYFDRLLCAIDLPLIIQDFNPGGPTIGPAFVAELHRAHPHFRYVKLEEPMMSGKVEAILQETHGEVGVIEGWGGLYMMELIPLGIAGVMPGLALADLLNRIWQLAKIGRLEDAYRDFRCVVPQIVYSLQNLELFHHAVGVRSHDQSALSARSLVAVFLNGRLLSPRSYSGQRIPVLEDCPAGLVTGEIIITPKTAASTKDLGIDVKVKGATVKRELFGMET